MDRHRPMSLSPSLDDRIGRPFYKDGAAWCLKYDQRIRGFALRRTEPFIPLERAIEMIKTGELLWTPPATMTPPAADATVDSVREQVELLDAFRRSPACMDSLDWGLRVRVDAQLAVARTWLSRRGLKPGSPSDNPD